MGEADLKRIEILGEKLDKYIRTYKLNENLEKQLIWKEPVG